MPVELRDETFNRAERETTATMAAASREEIEAAFEKAQADLMALQRDADGRALDEEAAQVLRGRKHALMELLLR